MVASCCHTRCTPLSGFTATGVVNLAQTVLVIKRIVGGVTRQAKDPLAQTIERNRHPGQFANHLFGVGRGVVLAFVIGDLRFARLRVKLQLGAAQRVEQQQAIVVLPRLLPEEASINFCSSERYANAPRVWYWLNFSTSCWC